MPYPGDDAARNDCRLDGGPRKTPIARDPVRDQLARGELCLVDRSKAEMAQPAEAVQLARPRCRRRWQGKGGMPSETGDSAGQTEVAGSQLVEKARIRRAQILRHDHQLVRRRGMQPA